MRARSIRRDSKWKHWQDQRKIKEQQQTHPNKMDLVIATDAAHHLKTDVNVIVCPVLFRVGGCDDAAV
jgi:hypothetical protein